MGRYILRRIALIVPTLFGIVLINFVIVQFAPGGPIDQIVASMREAMGQSETEATQEDQPSVSSSPARSAAGSPGVIWSRPKVKIATTRMVGITRSSRRPMYARMSCSRSERWVSQSRTPTVADS